MKKLNLIVLCAVLIYSCSPEEEALPQQNSIETPTTVEYILSVFANEGGTVSSAGGTYSEGTNVTITATANDGFNFVGWEGFDSDSSTIAVTVNSNLNITAVFERIDPVSEIIVKDIIEIRPDYYLQDENGFFGRSKLISGHWYLSENHQYWDTWGNYRQVIDGFPSFIESATGEQYDGLDRIVGEGNGVNVIIQDSFYRGDDGNQESHGDRVATTFAEEIEVPHTQFWYDGSKFDALAAARNKFNNNLTIITSSASDFTNSNQYEQLVRDVIQDFNGDNTLMVASFENQGDDGEGDFTHSVMSYDVIRSGNMLSHTLFVGSFSAQSNSPSVNAAFTDIQRYLDDAVFAPASSTSHATPKVAALAANYAHNNEGATASQIKDYILSLSTRETRSILHIDIENNNASEWVSYEVNILPVELFNDPSR